MDEHFSGIHDTRIVLLSIAIAVLASYTALDLGDRIKAARGTARLWWLTAGAAAMGGGIWSMHFIAMLAFQMPIPISYDMALTLASLLVAMGVTGIALFIASHGAVNSRRVLVAGVFMGLGVAAMHYVGMAAMRMAAEIHYSPSLFVLSVVIAIVAATAALWLALTMAAWWQKLASAVIMGAAIAGMHFTGMAAAHYTPADAHEPVAGMSMSPQLLALGVATATFYVLCLGLLSAIADRRLSATAALGAQALRQSERRHHSLVQNSSDIIAILDESGAFAYCSKSSIRILGYSATWLIGHRLSEFLRPEDAPAFQEFLAKVLRSSAENVTTEFQLRHASGTWLTYELACNNLKDDPAIGGVVANLRDTTERRRVVDELRAAKEQAEQGSRTKSEFLAAVSHELRTPLNAIIGFSEVIKSGMLGEEAGPRCLDYTNHIHESARHLLSVINNILDLSKAESRQMVLTEDYLRPADVLANCTHIIQPVAESAEVTLNTVVPDRLPFLYGDRRRLQQAVLNVVSNAIKFTKPGGRVEIRAVIDEASGLSLVVQDTGIGMAPNEIAVALEPFRQIDSRLNRRYEGSGLGLPLAKHLIELHGGALHIESAPGEGTRVFLRFPPQRVMWTAGGRDAKVAG